jgi:hypothetical protein
MSINAIRGLILLGNVVLIGIIGWICFGTFISVDQSEYFVEPPKLDRYYVADVPIDESQQKKELYKAITRALDRPEPPKPEAEKPAAPEAAPKADPRQIQVLAIQYSPNQERSSALLNAPLANPREPKFFQVGLDLGSPGLGFEAYQGCKVVEITADEVIVQDQKGNAVRLPGPRPKQGGG